MIQATKKFHQVCLRGRSEFAQLTPEMLKYQPKRFWGLLCKSRSSTVGVSAKQYAEFNQKLFFDESIQSDSFVLPDDLEKAKITTTEVKYVLESHFQANKSTGLSCLPLQCLKWMGKQAHPAITDFLNKSAIEQLAP